jgi:hypothetical protein
MIMVQDGPSPTSPTIQQDQVEAAPEGEVVSRREAPRCVQVDHPPSRIFGNINKHMTRSTPKMLLTLLIQLSLLPLRRKTLDTLYLRS